MSILQSSPYFIISTSVKRIKIETECPCEQQWILSLENEEQKIKTLSLTCEMMVSRDLRSLNPYVLISIPSINMDPLTASIIRNNDIVNDDFPTPVQPTTPAYD